MILHLSIMIASSLEWRLQIQNSTAQGGLSRGIFLTSTQNYAGGPAARFEEREKAGTPAPRQGTSSPAPLNYERIPGIFL
jgi:hypothetical protein